MLKTLTSKYFYAFSSIILGTLVQYATWNAALLPGERSSGTTFDYLIVAVFIAAYLIGIGDNCFKVFVQILRKKRENSMKSFQYAGIVNLNSFSSYYLGVSCIYLVFYVCANTNWQYFNLWNIITPFLYYGGVVLIFYGLSEGMKILKKEREKTDENYE